jgi:hypothetical protein
MWGDSEYCWVVFCRNWWFHRENILYGHRIPLAETDAVASLPPLKDHFMVRCDSCGKEYRYEPTDVFRYDHDLQTHSRPILFLKKNSSDVISAMSTTVGRIHSASRWHLIATDHAKSLRRSATVVVQRSGDWR